MQTIKIILTVKGGNTYITDEFGNRADLPQIKVGIAYRLQLDLREEIDQEDETLRLQPYPFAELSAASGFYLCLDGDWNHATTPQLFTSENIVLEQSADGRTLLTCDLPNTALPGILDAVKTAKEITTHCEIAGYAPEGDAADAIFAFDFDLTIRNRIYIGDYVPPEIVNNPDYLTAAQVNALIAEATRPVQNPGPPGKSAYQIAADNGFTGTEQEWLAALHAIGPDGLNAYEVAVQNGYTGTVEEWLETLEGASAYEVALADGYHGTRTEWLNSLKGADGQGLYYDASGYPQDMSLYDDRPAGFKFATSVTNTDQRTSNLFIYTKLSDASGDWSAPLQVTYFSNQYDAYVLQPVTFTKPANEHFVKYTINMAEYPHACVSQVSIKTADGELYLPYWSDFGIREIKNKAGMITIVFGSNLPDWTEGKIYFSQMVTTALVGSLPPGEGEGDRPGTETGPAFFGFLASVQSVTDITQEMLTGDTVTRIDPVTAGKHTISAVPGTVAFAVVPTGWKVWKDDGLGGKVQFDTDIGIPGTGANGAPLTVAGKDYRIYGEFNLITADTIIYIEKEQA